jgi:hypothetical protein
MKKNKNWWAIVDKETMEIKDVFKTREVARDHLWYYNLFVKSYKIEPIFIARNENGWLSFK